MTAPIVKVMVANKLPATVLAQVFLLVIAGFAVSLYILPTATGTANGILSFHTSNIPCLRCFLFARRLSAYILGHHPLVLAAQATPLKTAQGDVEIAKVPERIAVYDIGALDTLVALGLGDKIVGIPGEKFAADFATPNAKEVGTLFEPDLEALNAAKPDLIIVASRSAGKLDEVKAVAQAVDLSVPGDNAYQEGLARLESLGAVFGKEAEAKKPPTR